MNDGRLGRDPVRPQVSPPGRAGPRSSVFLGGLGGDGWQASERIPAVLLWVGCVFVSILVHEFGHALTRGHSTARRRSFFGGWVAFVTARESNKRRASDWRCCSPARRGVSACAPGHGADVWILLGISPVEQVHLSRYDVRSRAGLRTRSAISLRVRSFSTTSTAGNLRSTSTGSWFRSISSGDW